MSKEELEAYIYHCSDFFNTQIHIFLKPKSLSCKKISQRHSGLDLSH